MGKRGACNAVCGQVADGKTIDGLRRIDMVLGGGRIRNIMYMLFSSSVSVVINNGNVICGNVCDTEEFVPELGR